MGRQNVVRGDADMCAAVEEWIDEIERHHDCAVRIVISRGTLRKRLVLRVEACEFADGRLVSVRVRRKFSHPSGDAITLAGAVLSELTRLDSDLTHYANFVTGNGPLPDSPG